VPFDRPASPAPRPAPTVHWRQRAACARPGVDPEWFYPAKRTGGGRAKRVCAGCRVQAECLADALAAPQLLDLGIRAGLTELERRRLRSPRGRTR
jgi:WhiB family redox-sensing transcriptional regulator